MDNQSYCATIKYVKRRHGRHIQRVQQFEKLSREIRLEISKREIIKRWNDKFNFQLGYLNIKL
jgi:hypothetical protein